MQAEYWRSTTINYATENAVLSLCSMNIAKNHWVTLKCTVCETFHYTYWCLWLLALEHFTAFGTILLQLDYRTSLKTLNIYLGWTISKPKTLLKTTEFYLGGPKDFKNSNDSTSEGWRHMSNSLIFTHSYLWLLSLTGQNWTESNTKMWPDLHNTGVLGSPTQDGGQLDDRHNTEIDDLLHPYEDPVQNWQPLTKPRKTLNKAQWPLNLFINVEKLIQTSCLGHKYPWIFTIFKN